MFALALARAIGRNWGLLFSRGVVALLATALIIATFPREPMRLAGVFGAFVLMDAVLGVALGARARWSPQLWRGVFGIAVGLAALAWPANAAPAVVFLVGGWGVVAGLAELASVNRLGGIVPRERAVVMSGAAAIAMGLVSAIGIFVGVPPVMAFITYTLIAGVALSRAALSFHSFAKQARPQVHVLPSARSPRPRHEPGRGRETRP